MEIDKTLASSDRLVDENKRLISKIGSLLARWEGILVLIIIGMVIVFSNITPYFLDYFNLMNATFTFMEKAVLALPIIFIILSGDIDISGAAIIALSSFSMGFASSHGAGTAQVVITGLAVGALAGAFNAVFIINFGIPAIAVTLATQSFFRGISQAILEDQAYTHYPESFSYFGQGYIPGTIIPFELIFFLVLAGIFAYVLHFTSYGRKLYAIGNSATAARFSGVPVNRIRFTNFVLHGLFAGIVAVLLTSRIGSTRPNIANGWELEAITLVVLGGVSITGGKGSIVGVILSIFLIGYLKFGMGLINLSAKVMIITTGFLLITAVLIPVIIDAVGRRNKLKMQRRRG
ncbi:ABC transporter permease [Spirochaeta isovalerica]|uniref:Autoinducer 2 import system permease protein LsrD n=1 Tax=Spirochaeta isovalerica TaxID=150 RepID=A0A841RF41_9SPIO|nr:ABC transporter permease [Spirochaeta isovalerica]MBB6482001.1 rhamnose transport system permease protein [Spirochaeta isovalerica]